MRPCNNLINTPPTLGSKGSEKTTEGRHPLGFLLSGPGAILSGRQSPPGGPDSASRFPRRYTLPFIALLAVLAAGLLFLLPGGLLQAQNDGMIEYAENGTDAVATFTADDPEDRMVYWSLAITNVTGVDGISADDEDDYAEFSISADGVLSFNFPPDYENPRGQELAVGSNENTYRVVVVASDEPLGATNRVMGYKKVTVMVTDEDEPGMVTLSAQKPQIGVSLTAELTDDDATPAQITVAKWMWEHSDSENGPWTPILTATTATYSPLGVVDKYLRVTATYDDGHGSDKSVPAVSANMVRAVPAATNAAPTFPDGSNARSVDENSPPGTKVGKPVAANDISDDTLTYTLAGTDDGDDYRIDPATGQITVGPRTALDHEPNEDDTVTVTATDPAGGTADQPVTITINDVNEAPMITEGFTRNSQAEYDADDATGQTGIDEAKVVDTYMATDVDQDTPVTWSVSGTDEGDFDISATGALTFKEAPDYEMPADSNGDNVYMVTVVATDAGVDSKNKMTAERAVVVTITNVDEGGTVTLSSEQPKIGIELTATLEDPDGVVADSVKWTWHTAAEGAVADDNAIEMATSATYTPEEAGALSAKATYTDGHGANKMAVGGATNDVVVNIANVAPKFPDAETGMRKVAEGTAEGMEINDAADDTEADPVSATDANADDTLTYTLSGTDMASFDIVRATGQLQTKAELDYETKNSYMVTVTAADPDRASASIDVTIMVTDVDEAPEIAGDDITKDYPENGSAQVARFTASDPEDRMVYWSVLADDANFNQIDDVDAADAADADHFMINSDGVLSFKFSPDYEMPMGGTDNTNTYKVVVVASDDPPGAGDMIMMGYKKVTVNVTNVQETETITLSAQRAQVGAELTATYNDLDNERPSTAILMWKWYLGGSEIPNAITNTFTPDRGGSLRVEASYTRTDGTTKTVPKTISVRAEPSIANAAPTFPDGSNARSVDENSPPGTKVGKPVAANDVSGDTLTYTLSGTDSDSYRIDQATGQITVGPRTALNHEPNEDDTVTVTATDPWGAGATPSGATPLTVTITINDVNEAPMITEGFTRNSQAEYDADDATGQTGIDEAKVVDTYMATDVDQDTPVTWSVSGTDEGDFDISATGALTFKEAPDYEMPADSNGDNVYMVTVVATDAGVDSKNKMTAERAVVVTITNADEDGTVTLSSEQPKIGIELTATLKDPDGVVADSVKWTWHGSGDGTGDAIDMATSDAYTPEEAGALSAKATYTDGHGANKMAVGGATNEVVANLANVAPKFPDAETGMRKVAEGTAEGMEINDAADDTEADPVSATDANADDTLTYTLSGTDMASFDIVRATGQLQTKAELDYETKNSYMVTVTAADPDRASASIDVTIMVTDVDEAPEIMVGGLAISGLSMDYYAENGMDAVGTYTLAGSMKDRATLRIEGGADAGDFRLNNGMLMFRSSPDYEAPADADTDNTYMVTLKATDGTYMDTHNVMVMVTNVDEIGTVSGPESKDYMENGMDAVGTYTVTGGSMSDMATLTLMGDDMDDLSISTGGELTFDATPDFEMPMDQDMDNTYMVTVKAEAGGEMDTQDVMVMVTNVEEMGTLVLSSRTPSVDAELTATLTDPDGMVSGETWMWYKSMDMTFMDGTETVIDNATSMSYTPVAGDATYYLKVMVTYTDGEGSGKMEEEMTAAAVTAGDPLLAEYDPDGDGMIEEADMRQAVANFFGPSPTLSRADMRRLVGIYFN